MSEDTWLDIMLDVATVLIVVLAVTFRPDKSPEWDLRCLPPNE